MQEVLTRRLYKEIKEETGIDMTTINQVVQFMFGEVARTMTEGNLQKVDLQYLGSWSVKEWREIKLREKGFKPKNS